MEIKIPATIFGSDGKKELEKILAEQDEPQIAPAAAQPAMRISGRYGFVEGDTYAQALAELNRLYKSGECSLQQTFPLKTGRTIARPLTFEETVRVRVTDYNTLKNPDGSARSDEDRRKLFDTWQDTSTGIAYKAGTTKFKILPPVEELVGLASRFNDSFVHADYSKLSGVELDSSKGIYDSLLTKQQVLAHPAWNEAVTDKALLKEYAELAFSLMGNPEKAMGFWVIQNPAQDELRALVLYSIDGISIAYGGSGLCDLARFVRVDP